MKTNVAITSLASYWAMRDADELPGRELEVFEALAKHGPMTREEIAFVTRMKEGSACGRVNKLMERGLVVHYGYRPNPTTKKMNQVVDLAPGRRGQYQAREAA
jgi:DNA-binding Lrp family transcriptional regulator